jgi:hypothetical protein
VGTGARDSARSGGIHEQATGGVTAPGSLAKIENAMTLLWGVSKFHILRWLKRTPIVDFDDHINKHLIVGPPHIFNVKLFGTPTATGSSMRTPVSDNSTILQSHIC